ncbi:GIY-YIG nuclease family protein [Hymenobacter arcticus]
MANFGQSLRIYLADGVPTGIRLAEIVNWTGQAVACPRIRIVELAQWEEVARPGVYFLLQGGLGIDRGQVYIGESEHVRKRLGEQVNAYDFWTEAIAFTNKDANLTKAHVRYLESRLIALAKEANRYDVMNGNNGTTDPLLPRPDKAAMEEFLSNLRVVLSSLGHRLLEPLTASAATITTASQAAGSDIHPNPLAATLLHFATLPAVASGYVTDEGFTLLKNSRIKLEHTAATPKNVIALRTAAIAAGELVQREGFYELLTDKAFSSSSAAICFVSGNSRSGPDGWKSSVGLTLKQLEQQSLQSSLELTAEGPAVLSNPPSAEAEAGEQEENNPTNI